MDSALVCCAVCYCVCFLAELIIVSKSSFNALLEKPYHLCRVEKPTPIRYGETVGVIASKPRKINYKNVKVFIYYLKETHPSIHDSNNCLSFLCFSGFILNCMLIVKLAH